ncbi:unnamed protein product [Rhizoctonia solani]|uniref:NYN domain-containing protein n=1 Tax=Rhizoctonia solani TaxID=456999 RepID=A0A8H3D3J2_9AGAM|nr:unnamed protein product [Rhizoctonia solani]
MSRYVGIFWDYSSCPTNDTRDKSSIAISLREGCIKYGVVTSFKAYFGLPCGTPYEPPSASIRSEIEEVGVTTVDNPKTGFGALAADVFCFILDNYDFSASITVVFVSANPDIAHLVSALRARGVSVGLVTPSGQLNKLSSQASWTKDWENCTTASDPPTVISHRIRPALLGRLPRPVRATSIESDSDFSIVDGTSPTCDTSKNAALNPSGVEGKLETTRAPQAVTSTPIALPPLNITYHVPIERIPLPLDLPRTYSIWGGGKLTTTSHELQMFEDDPLYVELIKDPEAIKIKTWRRELKQLFFFQDISQNPGIQDELDTVFTLFEQYDKMSKNYLAFSGICKLLTQISQHYLDKFDYRQSCAKRARELLVKWEPLARSSDA